MSGNRSKQNRTEQSLLAKQKTNNKHNLIYYYMAERT